MGVGGASARIERQLSASWSAARLRSGPRPAGRVRRGVTRGCCAGGAIGTSTSTTSVLEVGTDAGVDSAGADTGARRACFARNAACLRARLLVSTAGHAARMCAFAASAYASGPAGRSARSAAGAYMRGWGSGTREIVRFGYDEVIVIGERTVCLCRRRGARGGRGVARVRRRTPVQRDVERPCGRARTRAHALRARGRGRGAADGDGRRH